LIQLITLLSTGVPNIAMSMPVCLLAYLENHNVKLH